MNETQYPRLRKKYGKYASWAIWNHEDEADPTIIESHIEELNVNHVFIAYNWSRKQGYFRDGPWANFRGGGSHARKLKYACNDTELRGSYITDLFKGITEPVAAKVRDYLTPERIDKNVSYFLEEMLDIGTTNKTAYIVLGVEAKKQFEKHFFNKMGVVDIKYYTHYSNYRLTDEKWVTGLWEELRIEANYDYETIRQKYK